LISSATGAVPAFDHALVVANPFSGNSQRRFDGQQALARVAPLGSHAELGWTKGPGHATELAAGWAAAGHDLVVAVGGDGTVHEVARGLVGTSCAMAVLPSGSGNDFAAGIGCGTVAEGLRTITYGEDHKVDACALNDMVFVNSCGLFASGLVSGVAAGYWRWLGRARYTLASVGTLLTYRGQEVTWTFDVAGGHSKATWTQKVLLAEVCNGTLTGGGFRFAPDASLTDGLLDAALIKPLNPWAAMKLLPQAASGERLDHPAISVHQGCEIGFESARSVAYHLDGEAAVLPPGSHRLPVLVEKLLVRTMQDL